MKNFLKDRSSWFLIGLILYLGLIFTLSHIPGALWAKVGFKLWDKLAHTVEYIPVGFMLMGWLLRRRGASGRRGRTSIIAVSIIAALAGLDEVHQIFVDGRDASLLDMAADVVGGGIGALVGLRILTLRWRRSSGEEVS